METIRHEGEDDSGNPRNPVRTCKRAGQSKSAIATQRKAKEHSDSMNSQRTGAQREQWKEKQRQTVTMFAKCERVAIRVENIRVKQIEWISEGGMVVPPKNPGHEVWITSVGNCIAQSRHVRPCQQGRKKAKGQDYQDLPN